jgi:hypothetical protein
LVKKDMKPSLTPCLLHEVILVFFAQRHDGGHVDLVEGREHGGLVLGGDEAFGDRLRRGESLRRVWRAAGAEGRGATGAEEAEGQRTSRERPRACPPAWPRG